MKKNSYKRTTIYIPNSLHDKAKMMALLTKSNLSKIMCIALREKLEELYGKKLQIEKDVLK